MPCGEGYTTLYEGAEAATACVIAPGWYWDAVAQQVVPCDQGYYCTGAVDSVFLASRTPCPTGTVTREEGATNITDCDGEYTGGKKGTHCSSAESCRDTATRALHQRQAHFDASWSWESRQRGFAVACPPSHNECTGAFASMELNLLA